MSNFKIGDLAVGKGNRPIIIAEMSGNHNQSLQRALEITEAAAKTGAHAMKLQTYTADTMTLDVNEGEFFIDDENSLWKGNSLYDLYKIAYTPWEWHEPIMKRANELGMLCFSTPFDDTAIDYLEDLRFVKKVYLYILRVDICWSSIFRRFFTWDSYDSTNFT